MPRQKEGTHIKEKKQAFTGFKVPSFASVMSSKVFRNHLSSCYMWSFRKELDLLLWRWLGKLKDINEVIKQRHCLVDRVIAGGSPICPEKQCHLIVGRLILKIHSCPGWLAIHKAMVEAYVFSFSLPVRSDTDSRLKFRGNSGSDLRAARAAVKSQLCKPKAKQRDEERCFVIFLCFLNS